MTFDGEDSPEVKDFLQLKFDEDAYDVPLGNNLDPTADAVVVAYNSLVTPLSHIWIPLAEPEYQSKRTVLKE